MFDRFFAASAIPAGRFAARKPLLGDWGPRGDDKPREVQPEILPPEHGHALPARVEPRERPVDDGRDDIPVGTFRSAVPGEGRRSGGDRRLDGDPGGAGGCH
jgi:hypothetical protein